ncbi:MAG: hypothetical protein Q7T03_10680 [Deltaproteobacteria bacterium]|nr:hypothetical protein [Deltaproteobacteria bacterium]
MMHLRAYSILLLLFAATACEPKNFTAWQTEDFDNVPITQSVTRTISLRNPSAKDVQTLLGIGFDGASDGKENFRIDSVTVGTRLVGQKDIVVPPGSSVNIQVTYEPRNLNITHADYGGWITGETPRFKPYKPGEAPPAPDLSIAVQRVVLLAVYDVPHTGITQIELIGHAIPGPNGELSLPEGGVGECEAGGGIGCFTGNFSIDIPKLFTTGPQETPLVGPIRFSVGDIASLRMGDMPPMVLPLKGNGPGEPLEGQPVSAVSIIIRGAPDVTATGTFNGSLMELQDLSFRVQVVVGEVDAKDVAGVTPLVDFTIDKLKMTTEEPLTDGNITMKIGTTLAQNPSANPIFDKFLGGVEIIVRFKGKLSL